MDIPLVEIDCPICLGRPDEAWELQSLLGQVLRRLFKELAGSKNHVPLLQIRHGHR